MIDEKLWNYLKSQFPEEVHKRLNGLTSNDATEEGIFYVEFSHKICEQGQIGEEFEKQTKELQLEDQRRRFESYVAVSLRMI